MPYHRILPRVRNKVSIPHILHPTIVSPLAAALVSGILVYQLLTIYSNVALRAHLLPHISPSQTTTTGTAPPGPAVGSTSPREVNPNIDPAISGVGVGSLAPQQQPQQQQQQQPIQQQSIQQQPVQHAIQQQVPQQMQQMQQMQHQHPQSPGVQNMQIGASPVMSQGMTMDQQHSQSQSGAEESEQPKARGGKRELSTSKRAAQNRAAQVSDRCFSLITLIL
jgi:hypothetical protein